MRGGARTHLVEAALEAALPFGAVVPFLVDDAEGDVLVGRAGDESDEARVVFTSWRERLTALATVFALNLVRGRFCFVHEVGVEDVELVALHNLGRGIIVVVVRLVVLVPFIAHLHAVEVAWLPRLVVASPLRPGGRDFLFGREDLLAILDAPRDFPLIEGHGRLGVVFLLDGGKSGRARGDGLAGRGPVLGAAVIVGHVLQGDVSQLLHPTALAREMVEEGFLLGLGHAFVLSAELQQWLRVQRCIVGDCGGAVLSLAVCSLQHVVDPALYRRRRFCLLRAQALEALLDDLLGDAPQLRLGLPHAQAPQQLLPVVVVDGLVRVQLALDLHLERLQLLVRLGREQLVDVCGDGAGAAPFRCRGFRLAAEVLAYGFQSL